MGHMTVPPRRPPQRPHPSRRQLLRGLGAAAIAAALDGCAAGAARPDRPLLVLPRLRATPELITRITVCTRPFRAAGPRVELEQIGAKAVVHNYGHGGSGWSLSWGSSAIAADLALRTGAREIAVIGCGALGITSALLLQRAGARVTIYAKELPPDVRSSLATGVWSPDSRICMEASATPAFKERWASMARRSFAAHQDWLGLPGKPVQFCDFYGVRDAPDGKPRSGATAAPPKEDPRPRFAELQHELIPELSPRAERFPPGTHSLGNRSLWRNPALMFNLNAYQRMLVADFLAAGGRVEVREFRAADELSKLEQKTLVNATGYGAKALLGDASIIPVRGQLARTPPQPGIEYGLYYKGAAFVPRPDGFVFQLLGEGDYFGYGLEGTEVQRPEAELAVSTIGRLFAEGPLANR